MTNILMAFDFATNAIFSSKLRKKGSYINNHIHAVPSFHAKILWKWAQISKNIIFLGHILDR